MSHRAARDLCLSLYANDPRRLGAYQDCLRCGSSQPMKVRPKYQWRNDAIAASATNKGDREPMRNKHHSVCLDAATYQKFRTLAELRTLSLSGYLRTLIQDVYAQHLEQAARQDSQ
jgi:hypothetical protein